MATIAELSEAETAFLRPYLPSVDGSRHHSDLPFVTLTYAQSLDGMISLAPGVSTTLSGQETKNLTQYLRLKHDAILVGVGTAVADNPGLNCRYPGATLDDQPRPIIIDPDMRWDLGESKMLRLTRSQEGKVPWIVHSKSEQASNAASTWGETRIYINSHDPQYYPNNPRRNGHHNIDWSKTFAALKQHGINSVMVEGGAKVIQQLLQTSNLVDATIITIAPTWLGSDGVLAAPKSKWNNNGHVINVAKLQQTSWRQFGADAVVCDLRPVGEKHPKEYLEQLETTISNWKKNPKIDPASV